MSSFLVPPPNFGMIADDLYRCGFPSVLNFSFLEKLQLKSIIILSPVPMDEALKFFLEDHEINVIHVRDNTSQNPWKAISEEVVIESLKVVLEAEHYPLLLMSRQGSHRTGTVVGCLRKLQGWNLTSIFEEYHKYCGMKTRLLNEQFIELFDTDLVTVPPGHFLM